MVKKKKRGVKPGTRRGPYKKAAKIPEDFGTTIDIDSILEARAKLRELVKSKIKLLNKLLKRI